LNHIRKKFNVKKVCIFDWDVHHGDGTEHLTYSDPSTLFISMHRYDERIHMQHYAGLFYPSSGHPERVGGKGAEGFNINVGWNVQQYGAKSGITAGAAEYLYAYTRLLEPIIREFAPEVIIISAGFDSAEGDPLGRCAMTPDGYAYITERLQRIQPKIVVVLEGGYNLDSISNAARSVFRVLAGEKLPHEKGAPAADDWILKLRPNIIGIKAVEATLKHHVNFWPVLSAPEQLNYDRRFLGEESKFITGGHLESFKIKGDKVYKKAKQNELLYVYIYTSGFTPLWTIQVRPSMERTST
jgi:histone deacetylase 6